MISQKPTPIQAGSTVVVVVKRGKEVLREGSKSYPGRYSASVTAQGTHRRNPTCPEFKEWGRYDWERDNKSPRLIKKGNVAWLFYYY